MEDHTEHTSLIPPTTQTTSDGITAMTTYPPRYIYSSLSAQSSSLSVRRQPLIIARISNPPPRETIPAPVDAEPRDCDLRIFGMLFVILLCAVCYVLYFHDTKFPPRDGSTCIWEGSAELHSP